MDNSPLFGKTHDLLRWLVPMTVRFPREQRFVMAQQVQQAAFSFQRHLLSGALGDDKSRALQEADIALARLRMNLRLCHELQLLNTRQFGYVSGLVDELGRLLGGWMRKRSSSG